MPGRIMTTGNSAKEKFTSHELDDGLDLYYMVARRYAPEFGRFLSVDPLADEFPEWSPYTYTLNNPLKFVDLDGRMPTDPPFEPDHREVRNAFLFEAFTEIKATFNLFKVKAIEIFVGDGDRGASVNTDGNVAVSFEDNSGKIEIDGDGQILGSFKVGDLANFTFDGSGKLKSAEVSIPINKAGTRVEGGKDNEGNFSFAVSQRFGKFIAAVKAIINPQENRVESNKMINEARENKRDVILDGF